MSQNDRNDNTFDEQNRKNKSTKITVGGLEININHSAFQLDSFELLEQLYLIKEDESLTNEEKQNKIQEVMKKYVG